MVENLTGVIPAVGFLRTFGNYETYRDQYAQAFPYPLRNAACPEPA